MAKLKEIIRKIIKPEENSLKIKSMRAAFWSLLGRGGSHALRMISNLILTRLLFPEAFGLMATASVILAMIQLFSDTGIKTAIIQNPKGAEPAFLNTAWIISFLRGILLFGIFFGFSWPMSDFYNQPELQGLLMIMAITPLIEGFENPALSLVIKNFRVEKQVAYELGTKLLELITTILLVIYLNSVYALAIGSAVAGLYRMGGSYLVVKYRPRFCWNKIAGSEIFHFGKFIFLNTMITWAVMNADILLIGKLIDMEKVGYYQIGKNLGGLVAMFTVQIITQTFLPAISTVHYDVSRVSRIYRRTLSLLLTIVTPISVTIAFFSNDIIQLLYDPRYQMSADVMFWMSLTGVVLLISQITGTTFIGMGQPAFDTICMGIGLIAIPFFIIIGVKLRVLHGAALGTVLAFTLIAIIESLFLFFKFKFSFKIVFRPWLQAIIVAAAIWGIFNFLDPFLQHEHLSFPFMFLLFIIGLDISVGVYILFEGKNPFRDEQGATRSP